MKILKRSVVAITALAAAVFAVSCGDSTTGPKDVSALYTITSISNTAVGIAGLNDQGVLAADFTDGLHPARALMTKDTVIDLGACAPAGINDNGDVLCGGLSVWHAGVVTPFPTPENVEFTTSGFSDAGVVTGTAGRPYVQGSSAPCMLRPCAFIATSAGAKIVEFSPSVIAITVPRMSNGSDVVVELVGSSDLSLAVLNSDSTLAPYACAGLPSDFSARAVGGNHEVVGVMASPDSAGATDAFVCKDGVVQSLGAATSGAKDVSHNGLIVGTTDDGHGFLWDNGKLTILNGGLYGEGWYVSSANWVNDAGQIIVTATDGSTRTETLLLTPK